MRARTRSRARGASTPTARAPGAEQLESARGIASKGAGGGAGRASRNVRPEIDDGAVGRRMREPDGNRARLFGSDSTRPDAPETNAQISRVGATGTVRPAKPRARREDGRLLAQVVSVAFHGNNRRSIGRPSHRK